LQTVNKENLLTAWKVGAYYKMVSLYETYSSLQFVEYQERLKLNQFVPSKTAQLKDGIEFERVASLPQKTTHSKRSVTTLFGRIYCIF
jgi:hypothetical protein